MTFNQFERALLVKFAHDEAVHTGSLASMKAVCYVIRNRVRAGWFDGSWTNNLQSAWEVAGNDRPFDGPPKLDVQNRLFQLLLRDIDDIFFAASEDETQIVVGECLYYHFIDRPVREWFVERVIRETEAHPRRAHVGSIVLYE